MTNEEFKSDWANEKAQDLVSGNSYGDVRDLIGDIAAALREEREAAKPKWLPIETAPKFHHVLVCDKDGNLAIAYTGVGGRFWDAGEEVFPICWMPAPDLPGSDAARKSEPQQQEPSNGD
jgi:hypothetical protein